MKYNEWRGSLDGRPVFLIKHIIKIFGCKIDVHKMIRADDAKCFHTHPAYAIRLILFGGYTEELPDGRFKTWLPGNIGIVKPEFCHRVHSLVNKKYSFSLWLRGKICREVELIGSGWRK